MNSHLSLLYHDPTVLAIQESFESRYLTNTTQKGYAKKKRKCAILDFKRKERINKSVKKIYKILSAT